MKRTLLSVLIIILFLAALPVYSQENSIFTPFVSRIKVHSSKSYIKLSWKDTEDVDGNCIIYRHTSPISSDNINSSVKIARVPKGLEYYEDFPPYTHTNYYYAILMEDTESLLHEVFIPLRNLSSSAAFITEKTKDNSPALITAIKAWTGKESVQLSFKCSKPASELFIYRNTSPIEDKNDILEANLIATLSGSSTSYTDYPVPGISYYYGIIDSNLIKTGNYIFKAGENVTIVPVELALSSTERVGLPDIPSSRPKPLPYLSISRAYQSGRQLSPSIIDSTPDKKDVSSTTEASIKALTTYSDDDSSENLELVILKQDQNPASGSEKAMLSDILESDFLTGNFDSARIKLEEFRKVRRSKEMEASVYFYLGQINYFLGNHREAFTDFLFAEEYYYMESRPWIDTLFKELRTSE